MVDTGAGCPLRGLVWSSCELRELAGLASSAGSPGECLGDTHPFFGRCSGDTQRSVGHMAALGNGQTEVEGGAGHHVGVTGLVVPRPTISRWASEFHSDGGVGGSAVVGGIGERSGSHPDVGYMLEAIRRCTYDCECVGHVLTVSPGLHEPSGGEREGSHRWAIPRESSLGVKLAERIGHGGPCGSKPVEQLGWGHGSTLGDAQTVDALGEHGARAFLEPVFVCGRQQPGPIEECEVAHLVSHRPSLGRGGLVPVGRREGLEDGEQISRLRLQVIANRIHARSHR